MLHCRSAVWVGLSVVYGRDNKYKKIKMSDSNEMLWRPEETFMNQSTNRCLCRNASFLLSSIIPTFLPYLVISLFFNSSSHLKFSFKMGHLVKTLLLSASSGQKRDLVPLSFSLLNICLPFFFRPVFHSSPFFPCNNNILFLKHFSYNE